jgi:radical SAM enzyme (rSAM/lipoprotein system)
MESKIPLRKKVALRFYSKYKNNTAKLHTLNYLFWECTMRCNLNCLHCGSDCRKESSVKDMPVSDFLRAVDQIIPIVNPNKTTVVFTGGEPLLRKDLEFAGKELYNRGFPWGLVTNGVLLFQTRLKSLLSAGLRTITISLDGLEDSHLWLRGANASFGQTLKTIKMVAENKEVVYDVATCVNQKNIGELQNIYELLSGLNVKAWRLFTIFPVGRAKENELLRLTPPQFRELFDFISLKRKSGLMSVSYGCEGFLGRYETEVRNDFFFCRAGINVVSILADGSISSCPSIRSDFVQGNIYTDRFDEVWEKRFALYRDRSWAKSGICAECSYFWFCQGNGMHLRDKNLNGPFFCHFKMVEEK